MASSLIDTLSGDFDPSQYKDDYREALQAVIDAKVEGREVVSPSEPEETGGAVLDLMAALRASVDAAKGRKSSPAPADDSDDSDDEDEAPAQKPAAKKSTAKKAAAKKAPAKKAPAKQAAAKRRSA
jgi:DNA end-binding protein Ku